MLLSNAQSWFSQESINPPTKFMNGSSGWGVYFGALYASNASSTYSGTGQNCYYVIIGGGDTPVTFDDYDMADSSILGSGKMVSSNQTSVWNNDTGVTITTTWTNTSDSPITIKEVGVASKNGGSTANSKAANTLISRHVLSTPLTIQPNESYVFMYIISVK